MQPFSPHDTLTKKFLLMNYLHFQDFEMSKILLTNFSQIDPPFLLQVCKMIIRTSQNPQLYLEFLECLLIITSSRPNSLETNPSFTIKLYSFILKLIKYQGFITEFPPVLALYKKCFAH